MNTENNCRNKIFSASGIAKIAVFSAVGFLLSFLEFPIFPAAPFLKLDFANVTTLLGGFILGPVPALIISAVKELLCLLKSSTGGVGEIANFILTASFVLLPSIVYRYKKGLKTVILSLAAACMLQTAAGLIVNRFINFPLYMGEGAAAAFKSLWYYILFFNLIKSAAISAIVLLTYKRISTLLSKF